MHSTALLKLQKFNHKFLLTRFQQRNRFAQADAGFSMIEIIAVVLMIGILAAIALPSWSAFINRQRVNKTNDAVLAAIQDAQRQAKQKKLAYSVSFKVESQIPKIVIHPDTEAASSIASNRWRSLIGDLSIKPGQVILTTNLSGKNTVGTSFDDLSTPQTIAFDYMGTLINPNFPTGSTETPGIKLVASNGNLKRCVIIKTILGATLTKRDAECD
ncbi:type II secretion system protein [Nostoc sp. TCL26-01]|uniref:type II secretion system protein n=1 Tax=Nostoc sp. TCL26-01 TaxID=2576904 RepID=UPI0015BC3B21|nr:type II secretion system protein [Nostoc sp. TCL26-01]QLE57201.1 type II secretion system protein [Nostoc sp. TCL26-01]